MPIDSMSSRMVMKMNTTAAGRADPAPDVTNRPSPLQLREDVCRADAVIFHEMRQGCGIGRTAHLLDPKHLGMDAAGDERDVEPGGARPGDLGAQRIPDGQDPPLIGLPHPANSDLTLSR